MLIDSKLEAGTLRVNDGSRDRTGPPNVITRRKQESVVAALLEWLRDNTFLAD